MLWFFVNMSIPGGKSTVLESKLKKKSRIYFFQEPHRFVVALRASKFDPPYSGQACFFLFSYFKSDIENAVGN